MKTLKGKIEERLLFISFSALFDLETWGEKNHPLYGFKGENLRLLLIAMANCNNQMAMGFFENGYCDAGDGPYLCGSFDATGSEWKGLMNFLDPLCGSLHFIVFDENSNDVCIYHKGSPRSKKMQRYDFVNLPETITESILPLQNDIGETFIVSGVSGMGGNPGSKDYILNGQPLPISIIVQKIFREGQKITQRYVSENHPLGCDVVPITKEP
jgi:hypothetical protein